MTPAERLRPWQDWRMATDYIAVNLANPWWAEWRMPVLALVGVTLTAGCNSVFGIHEGAPRPMCTDSLMIDDMEDGDGSICRTGGRRGVRTSGWRGGRRDVAGRRGTARGTAPAPTVGAARCDSGSQSTPEASGTGTMIIRPGAVPPMSTSRRVGSPPGCRQQLVTDIVRPTRTTRPDAAPGAHGRRCADQAAFGHFTRIVTGARPGVGPARREGRRTP